MLLTGMLLILFWSQMVFSSHEFDSCDQPLALMIRLIFIIVMVQTMQKAISRHCLCYDAVEDGPPEPLRVRVFRALAVSAAVLWPLVAGVMLLQSKTCSKALTTAVAVIIGYYVILVIVVLVLPAVALGVVLCLIRRGRLRLPRMPGAAPEGAVESLPVLEFDTGRFCEDGRGEFPASCAVCLETFTAQKEIVKMPCNHVFHRSCLSGWFQVARTCPLCRGDVEQVIV
ncbi:RHC2A [Symbiodinium microadriaticum]|nr:RHC2A [Symbiodinium microadriaticum]